MDGNRYLCRFRRKNENQTPTKYEYWFLVESLDAVMFLHKHLESIRKFQERDMEYYHESLMEISDRECKSFGEKLGRSSEGGYIIYPDNMKTIEEEQIEAERHKIGARCEETVSAFCEYDKWECVHIFPIEVFARIREF